MPHGIIGRKYGMSRIFQEDGTVVPVTLVKCSKNIVSQVKSFKTGDYKGLVLSSEPYKRPSKTKKFKLIKEVPVLKNVPEPKLGDEINVEDFKDVLTVMIHGVSKGKGFQGVIKRHKFHRGPETHGSDHHRAPGSIGTRALPGRVMKGKKMGGRMGSDSITLKNIAILDIYPEEQMLALKGALPGAKNSILEIIVQEFKS